MNITFNFYLDDSEGASLVGFEIGGSFVTKDRDLFEGISAAADTLARAYIEALNTLIGKEDIPISDPVDPTNPFGPVEPEPDPYNPVPTPTPVNPPVVDRSIKAAPEESKYTMEDVRKALIEVKKTKGAEGLKRCFDIIGASSLTAVDEKDYTKLYDLAKGELNAK